MKKKIEVQSRSKCKGRLGTRRAGYEDPEI